MTDRIEFRDGSNSIVVEVLDTMKAFTWRLSVNGDWSSWHTHYSGILMHRGYGLATAYWRGIFPEFVPFKVVALEEKLT